MDPISLIISEVLYRPVFNLIVVFLGLFDGSLGWAIIFMTIVVRLLLLKSTMAGSDMQKSMGGLQPKMQEIQEKYKDDPKKLSDETMKLLKKEGAGPLKGCMSMLVQIPVFIGLFFVIRQIAANTIPAYWLYSFFYGFGLSFVQIDGINTIFYGFDLLATGAVGLAVFASVFTYLQMKLTMLVRPQTPKVPGASAPDMDKMMGFMNIFMVVIMFSFVSSTAGAIGLYIATTSLFSVLQYGVQYKSLLWAKARVLMGR